MPAPGNPFQSPATITQAPLTSAEVKIVDIDLSFWCVLKLAWKFFVVWMIFAVGLWLVFVLFGLMLAALFGASLQPGPG